MMPMPLPGFALAAGRGARPRLAALGQRHAPLPGPVLDHRPQRVVGHELRVPEPDAGDGAGAVAFGQPALNGGAVIRVAGGHHDGVDLHAMFCTGGWGGKGSQGHKGPSLETRQSGLPPKGRNAAERLLAAPSRAP